MPAVVFILGIISAVILFWVYRIAERQRITFEHIDTVMDIQDKTQIFHLWFEEALSKNSREEMQRTFADLDGAMRLSDALLVGGKSEGGTALSPLTDPFLVGYARSIRALLISFRENALQRYQNPETSGIGSPPDALGNIIFREFQKNAQALELATKQNKIRDDVGTQRLFVITVFLWAFIVLGSTIGLYKLEHRRRQAVQALEGAYEEAGQIVKVRTAELEDINSRLQEEIVERIKAEDSLRESESDARQLSLQFHTLLDAIPDSILLISPDLKILWENKAAASTDKVAYGAGQYCYKRRYDASAPCKGCPVLRSVTTQKVEYCTMTADGRTWELRTFPILSEDGRIENVIEIATDITEKINLQAETLRASHLASIGKLAAGVAHEINNPVNGIINYARILSNKGIAGSTENDIAGRITKEGRRIAGIVNSLLAFARDRKEVKEPVKFEHILQESLTLTESQMRKKGIHLKIDLPPALPEIIANQQQIQQVVINIITNAQYALNQKYPGEHEDKVLDISCAEIRTDRRPFVRTRFRDHGTGIAPDILDKIMNPFFTTKPAGEGTGLGLSISHGIIGDHGGRLAVNSVPGEFTEVLIDLPAKENHGEDSYH